MPYDQDQRDTNNNFVVVTLFESYLSRFILEKSDLYKACYLKVLDSIERNLTKHPESGAYERHLYTIFSRVNSNYPGYISFHDLKSRFNLGSTDYCLKLIADEVLILNAFKTIDERDLSETPPSTPTSPCFFDQSKKGKRSPYNPSRCPNLFNEQNRGVSSVEAADDFDEETQAIGIVDEKYMPDEFKNYFMLPIHPARFIYKPNEESYVAGWLRERHLPVIAGSSGSTEILFSRILPLVLLDPEEIKIIVFSQACNMVANGHHSLFEALLVADYFDLKIRDSETLFEFYLQCIPPSIKCNPDFIGFINTPRIKELLEDMPLYVEGARQEIVNVPGLRM